MKKQTLLLGAALAAGVAVAAIDRDAAAQAALKHAGVASLPANALLVTPDYDDGRAVYDVNFQDGKTKFDYEIDANTGAVLKAERKALPTFAAPAPQPAVVPATPVVQAPAGNIAEAEAKAIALAQAGLAEGQISRYRAKFEIDDGVPQWDLEFTANKYKYEYTINAATRAIIDFERERDTWWD
ncbi:MAG TPA: PepSY domain-containing protein [Candidatus Spyradenecus faecavium]|uniref:PepSY domain-containing protein n=1 Tax=Candidatus Spyradenecus faecavium TaxID=2840947 RepID=A0A9D1NME6_9BACT|nr:PepSY domain-containing protein [Candidatus Spyradenecus faecavium]